MNVLLLRHHSRALFNSSPKNPHSIRPIRRLKSNNVKNASGNRVAMLKNETFYRKFHTFGPLKYEESKGFTSVPTNRTSREKLVPYLTRDTQDESLNTFKVPKILVIGVGGAGGNVVNLMMNRKLEGVDFVSANTDAQALSLSKAPIRIQLGSSGLGAGANPEVGRESAKESLERVIEHIEKVEMVFVLAGMGGGTGTGAAPVIANAAKERGILTVGIVTTPFSFEGSVKERLSKEGIHELEKAADSLVVIPNQRMLDAEKKGEKKETFMNSFDDVNILLSKGVETVSDLLASPGFVNVDLSDVQTTMRGKGRAYIGNGEGTGEGRATKAVRQALFDPFGNLDESVIRSSKNVLVNIYGGDDLDLSEVQEITSIFKNELNPEAHVIFGTVINQNYNNVIKVSLIATGIDVSQKKKVEEEEDKIAKLMNETQEIVQKAFDDPHVKNFKDSIFKLVRKWW